MILVTPGHLRTRLLPRLICSCPQRSAQLTQQKPPPFSVVSVSSKVADTSPFRKDPSGSTRKNWLLLSPVVGGSTGWPSALAPPWSVLLLAAYSGCSAMKRGLHHEWTLMWSMRKLGTASEAEPP